MVMKLKELCLIHVGKEFINLKLFDRKMLSCTQKEILIEYIANHGLLNYNNKFNNSINKSESTNQVYRKHLVESLFNGHLNEIKFTSNIQLDDSFFELISNQKNLLKFKSLMINKCSSLTDLGIKQLVSAYSYCLEELTINNLNIDLCHTLKEIRSANLTRVNLSFCSLITDVSLWNMCKNNPYIKQLKLTHCIQLTNEGVQAALHLLYSIEYLDIEGIKEGGCSFCSCYSSINLKNLNKLVFSGSDELRSSLSMKKIFKNCQKLKELQILYSSSLSNQENDSDSPIKYLPSSLVNLSLYRPSIADSNLFISSLQKLNNLTALSLYCVECISDNLLVKILENNGQRLNHLGLTGFVALPDKITDASLKHVYKNCKQLKSISFDFLSITSSFESLLPYFEQSTYASKFVGLNFSACRNLSKNVLLNICLNCSQLVYLNLSGLNQILNDDLIILLSESVNNLKELDVKGCTQLTDISICALVSKCRYIEILVLAGISSLTDKCIFSIANNLQLSLKEIYLSGCLKVSNAALRYLTDCCFKYLYCEHSTPNLNPNQLMAKNLDTGLFERVDI